MKNLAVSDLAGFFISGVRDVGYAYYSVAGEPEEARERVVSFSPRRALRTQSGSSTPNPAPESSGPVWDRNRNAPGVSSSTMAGAASRSTPSISPNSRAAAPRPASSSSTGSGPAGRWDPAEAPARPRK